MNNRYHRAASQIPVQIGYELPPTSLFYSSYLQYNADQCPNPKRVRNILKLYCNRYGFLVAGNHFSKIHQFGWIHLNALLLGFSWVCVACLDKSGKRKWVRRANCRGNPCPYTCIFVAKVVPSQSIICLRRQTSQQAEDKVKIVFTSAFFVKRLNFTKFSPPLTQSTLNIDQCMSTTIKKPEKHLQGVFCHSHQTTCFNIPDEF